MPFALITGASQGIGSAIAEELAKRGKDVLLVARNADALRARCSALESSYNIKAFYFTADLTRIESASALFSWCRERDHKVDLLVNNAGYGLSGVFDELSLQEQLDMMQVNMNAVVTLTHLFLPLLRRQNRSWILNIGSTAGYQPTPFLSVYGASKAFLRSFSRGLRQELCGSTVSVTCVNPGPTDTGFNERARVGAKARNYSRKLHMSAADVAKISVDALYARKPEVVTGAVNKVGAFLSWLLPSGMVTASTAKIYR